MGKGQGALAPPRVLHLLFELSAEHHAEENTTSLLVAPVTQHLIHREGVPGASAQPGTRNHC